MFKIKFNENLAAIFTYLRSYEYHIDMIDLVQWCIDYGYYKELYENFHIINNCLFEHNIKYTSVENDSFTFKDEIGEFK